MNVTFQVSVIGAEPDDEHYWELTADMMIPPSAEATVQAGDEIVDPTTINYVAYQGDMSRARVYLEPISLNGYAITSADFASTLRADGWERLA